MLAVREALPGRYRLLLVIGAGLGLRQGEALGLALEDIDFAKEVVHVRRQVKMVRAKLCFALPKGRKVRDVPLPSSVARAIRQHMEHFAPVPVTLPWDDPTPAATPVEAKHRRPRTHHLLVTGRERKAINRNYFNSYVWKPALAMAGVIAALDEGSADGARVWEPSGSTASTSSVTSLPPKSWRPANRSSPWHAGWDTPTPGSRCGSTPTSCPRRRTGQCRRRRDLRLAEADRQSP
ncbi:tyrosine-type recombinase/integrase [Streptomyces sp. DSM 41014]|uniref:Tyrosine-type recombinase/integrase n=1 Tax=Streptomyces hintoniae TaxID=3075521 RepID=A0ABU2UVB9_9ACTN|nr:tyrosine-type recombinase/integrase [Streptomyces sp. DSM 41014]MDT0476791.1 tyrosine-type recombinase/integrase [Streptomyces sp. DSM 41014]